MPSRTMSRSRRTIFGVTLLRSRIGSEAEEVVGTLPLKCSDFRPLRDHRVLRAMSSPPATETADSRVNKACQELFWVCT